MKRTSRGFTLIELLVVIAVIGILATIGVISYDSIQANTRDDQRSSKIIIIAEALEKYYSKYGEYPSCAAMTATPASTVTTNTLKGLDPDTLTTPSAAKGTNSITSCVADPTSDTFSYFGGITDYTLKYKEDSSGNVISLNDRHHVLPAYTLTITAGTGGTVNTAINGTYTSGSTPTITASPGTSYSFSNWSGSTGCSGAASHAITMDANKSCTASFVLDSNWLAIGTQVWAKANLNVGTMVTGVTNQTNNAVLEKYCYNNTESNCTTYGALYQWDEAMQYVTTQGAQGMCPAGSHIPSDNDWKILEMQLGMTQAQADATDSRGTDQGTQLKPGGSSGLNMPLGGERTTYGSFGSLSSVAYLWSSSEVSSAAVWDRYMISGDGYVVRSYGDKVAGYSVRCLGN